MFGTCWRFETTKTGMFLLVKQKHVFSSFIDAFLHIPAFMFGTCWRFETTKTSMFLLVKQKTKTCIFKFYAALLG